MRPNFTNRGNNRPGNGGGYNNTNAAPASSFDPNKFKNSWIANEIDESFIEYAKEAGEELSSKGLTSSQIRNVYGEIKRIQVSGGYTKHKTSFLLLKPKLAYNTGRSTSGVAGISLFQKIFDKAWMSVSDDRTYNNFCDVMEAILAYHRAKEGKR